jgi:1,4-dihydroxy-2-naphthoyl-CoA hydrolase
LQERIERLTDFFWDKVPGMFGFEVTKIDREGAEGRLTVREALIAGNGYVFAPVIVGMADFLCAVALSDHLPEGAGFTTVEIKTNFLSTARAGDLVVGRSWPVHLGRTTQVWDATITNATTGRDMALFRNTQLVLPAR